MFNRVERQLAPLEVLLEAQPGSLRSAGDAQRPAVWPVAVRDCWFGAPFVCDWATPRRAGCRRPDEYGHAVRARVVRAVAVVDV